MNVQNLLPKNVLPEKPHEQKTLVKLTPRQGYYKNPYRHETFLDTNPLLKIGFMSGVSYAMGIAMGAFMNLHTIDTIDYGVFRSSRSQFKISSLDYVTKVRSSGRGFAAFGIIYAILELCLEKVRPRADGTNSFVSGGLCTVVLALDSGMGPKGLFNTFLIGGALASGMEELMADKMG